MFIIGVFGYLFSGLRGGIVGVVWVGLQVVLLMVLSVNFLQFLEWFVGGVTGGVYVISQVVLWWVFGGDFPFWVVLNGGVQGGFCMPIFGILGG